MEIVEIIVKPYLTEKTYTIKGMDREVLTFVVNPKANKHQIQGAFMAIYGVKPEKINVQLRKPANIRMGTRTPGRSKLMKIAYVTLPKGVQVAVTKEEIDETTKAGEKKK